MSQLTIQVTAQSFEGCSYLYTVGKYNFSKYRASFKHLPG